MHWLILSTTLFSSCWANKWGIKNLPVDMSVHLYLNTWWQLHLNSPISYILIHCTSLTHTVNCWMGRFEGVGFPIDILILVEIMQYNCFLSKSKLIYCITLDMDSQPLYSSYRWQCLGVKFIDIIYLTFLWFKYMYCNEFSQWADLYDAKRVKATNFKRFSTYSAQLQL